ncbi:MAG: apolipoprotein N-acyltransferase [Deltaproteobacteria bacterium]|nr:apolipoprotein N-acyltransferase [Deltaproteobacteria bacterium]
MRARLLLTLGSAVAYGLAFPGPGWHWLAWVAVTPLLVAARGTSPRAALVLGFTWGTAMACVVADWMPGAIVRYWQQPWLVGVAVLLGGTILTSSVFYMLFTAWYAATARAPRASTPLLAACAWVAVELGRTELLIGNPWALLGYSQVRVPVLLQVAEVTGVYGVAFPVVAVNAALVELWVAWRARRSAPDGVRHAARGALGAVAAVVLVLGFGSWRLSAPGAAIPATTDGAAGEVVVVQGNLDLGTQWREEMYGTNLDKYLTLTRDAIARGRADVVVWPENAMSFFVEREPAFRAAIAAALDPTGAELLVGGPRHGRDAGGVERYRNAAFLLTPTGTVAGVYEKQQLVPFAEAFPLLGAAGLRERFGRVREFTPGSATAPLPTRLGPAGILICNEAMFPRLAAARVLAGAAWLVTLTNDSWVGAAKYAAIASDMALVRAVEQRRYLVRASTAGPSAIVDPLGRVVAEVPFPSQATIAGRVAAASGLTLYARTGDAFALACVVAALAALALAWRRARRHAGAPVFATPADELPGPPRS